MDEAFTEGPVSPSSGACARCEHGEECFDDNKRFVVNDVTSKIWEVNKAMTITTGFMTKPLPRIFVDGFQQVSWNKN